MKLLKLMVTVTLTLIAISANALWVSWDGNARMHVGNEPTAVANDVAKGNTAITGSNWLFTCTDVRRGSPPGDNVPSLRYWCTGKWDGNGPVDQIIDLTRVTEDSSPCSAEGETDNPVNIAHGEKRYHFVDVRESSSFPLVFERKFRQKQRVYWELFLSSDWYFSYISKKLQAVSSDTIIVQPGDGSGEYTLSWSSGLNKYISSNDGVYSTIVPIPASGTQTGWRLVYSTSGASEEYDLLGNLTKEITKDGYSHSLSYDTTLSPNTVTITDDQTGRRLEVAIVSGKPTQVKELDSPGQPKTTYEWDSRHRLRAVIYPDDHVDLFEYNPSADAAKISVVIEDKTSVYVTDRITGIFEISKTEYLALSANTYPAESKRYSKVTYDSTGRVSSSALWDGSQLTEALTFGYNWNWSVDTTTPTTTVTNSQSLSTTYSYTTSSAHSSNNWKLVSVNGSAVTGVTGCASTSASSTYTQTGNAEGERAGYLKTTSDNTGSIVTKRTRDGLGRITVLETALNGSSNPVAESQKIVTTGFLGDTSQPIKKDYYGHTSGTWVKYRTEEFAYDVSDEPCSNAATPTNRICSIKTTDKTGFGSEDDASPYGPRTRSYTYTYSGTLLESQTVTDPRGNATAYNYHTTGDYIGQLYSIAMPAPFTGGVVQTTYYSAYNSLGQPTTITEPNNKVTTLDYDVRGRLRLSSTTDGTTTLATRIGYYPNGLVQYVISPDSTYLKYVYNNAHQLTDVYQRVLSGGDPSDTDALLGHVHYTPSVLDGKWTDAITYGTNDSSVVLAQHRVFDAIGRLRILKDAANSENKTEMSYDANDNLKAIVALGSGVSGYDNDNHVTYREFDKQNRIKCTMDTAPSAPSTCMGAAVSTRYAYDDQGNIAKVTDANGHETDYNYNGFGELVTLVSPETGTTTFEYDHAGNLHIKTKAAQLEETDTDQQVITYTWDALNRLINIDYAQPGTTSQEVSYTYDEHNAVHGAGIGHLTTVVDGSGTTAYKYDSLGGVTQKQQTLPGSLVRTTGYHYDSVHRLDSVTYPSGEVIAVGYNSTSKQLDYLTDGGAALISAVTHQPFGGLTGWQTNSGTDLINQYVRTFDTEGRLDQWGVANHTSLASRMRQLQYDAYSGISGVQNLSDPTRDEQYEYDVQSRLTKVTAEYGRITYGYDNVGNRTSKFFEQLNPTSQIWSELYTEIYSYINPATTTVDSNRVYAIARTRGGSTGLSMREFSYNHRGNVKQDIRQKVSELSPRTYGLNYGNNDRLNIISAP